MAFPPLQAVEFAVSIIRMGVEDLYLDIKEELDGVKGQGALEEFKAFWRGFRKGLGDFLTVGLFRQMDQLAEQEKRYYEFLRNLSSIDSYFRMSTSEDGLTELNFANGSMSSYGGFINVQSYDDSTFKVRVGNIATSTGQVAKEGIFYGSNVTNIVLGIGQSVNMIKRGHEDAKLFLVIPAGSYDTFKFAGDDSSLQGRYIGNSNDNKFISIQGNYTRVDSSDECAYQKPSDPNSSEFRLQRYYYELYGEDGRDTFHLGPQSSFLMEGEGADTYIFKRYSGSSVIHNFAVDQIEDVLFLNLSHRVIQCSKVGYHLNITYCGTRHIQVRDWYKSKSYQHLTISTRDGFAFRPFDKGFSDDFSQNVACMAIAIDKSSSARQQVIDLRMTDMNQVSRIVGSNYSDNIYGNDRANYIVGGPGNDYMAGGNGEDMYIIREEGMDIIDVKAEDNKIDTILFLIPYNRIAVRKLHSGDIFMYDTGRRNSRVRLKHLETSNIPSHEVLITSSDHVLFKIKPILSLAKL